MTLLRRRRTAVEQEGLRPGQTSGVSLAPAADGPGESWCGVRRGGTASVRAPTVGRRADEPAHADSVRSAASVDHPQLRRSSQASSVWVASATKATTLRRPAARAKQNVVGEYPA
jgi:hypothetical protein